MHASCRVKMLAWCLQAAADIIWAQPHLDGGGAIVEHGEVHAAAHCARHRRWRLDGVCIPVPRIRLLIHQLQLHRYLRHAYTKITPACLSTKPGLALLGSYPQAAPFASFNYLCQVPRILLVRQMQLRRHMYVLRHLRRHANTYMCLVAAVSTQPGY